MLRNSTGSINQFLQNKSNRNNFIHSIKYTNRSSVKEPYFNKSIFNNSKEIISPKFSFKRENHLLTPYNESLDNRDKKEHIKKTENKLNRSSDNYPKIILTKRGIKQITSSASNLSLDVRKDYYHKSEGNMIRRTKSGYSEIPISVKKKYRSNINTKKSDRNIIQESSSLPKFNDNNSDINQIYKKEKSRYARRNINIKNKNSLNDRQSSHLIRNKSVINDKRSSNFPNKKEISLEKKRIYNNYSLNNIYEEDKKNKNQENHNYTQIKNAKLGKGETREEYKRSNSIFNKKNNLNLYEDFSNLKINNNQTIKNDYEKNEEKNNIERKRIINNKRNHVVYISKNLKKDKQIENQRQKLLKIKIINTNENKSVKNIINFKNYKKTAGITKLDEEKELDNNKDIKDKIIIHKNRKSLTEVGGLVVKIDVNKEIDTNNKNINNNMVNQNQNSSYTDDNQLKNISNPKPEIKNENNDINETEPKNSTKKINKGDNQSLLYNDKIINEIKKDLKSQQNDLNLNSNITGKENKLNIKMKNKKLIKVKDDNNGLKNKTIFEICKVSEVIFKGIGKNKINELSQNNTTNSNIIIIINNREKKRFKGIARSGIDNTNNNNHIVNSPNIKKENISDNKQEKENNDKEKIS